MGLIAISPVLLSTGRSYVSIAVMLALGATEFGRRISIRCRSALGSAPGLKVALAPPTVADFTVILGFNLTVNVRPDPLPDRRVQVLAFDEHSAELLELP
jgi:hypothetical protein